MDIPTTASGSRGHTLVELVVVLGLLGFCTVTGLVALGAGLGAQQSRGAAQSWQAAAAWSQVGVMWHGGDVQLTYHDGMVRSEHSTALCGGRLGLAAPAVSVTANVARWVVGDQVVLKFGGSLASPDSGGSVYFDNLGRRYRVVVRPESGLTVRTASFLLP